MKSETTLTHKEKLFCGYCARLGDPFQAARRAGYRGKRPGDAVIRLMGREEIRREIQAIRAQEREEDEAAALAALRRMALGGVGDAVRLVEQEELAPEELEALDLFALSELKRQKGGGWELKLQDRNKALQLLLEYGGGKEQDGGGSLLQALEKGAQALAEAGGGDEDED